MLALRNQTLVNGAGQHRDAVPADLVSEVLAGDADSTRAGRTEDIHIQVIPLVSRGTRGGGKGSRQKKTYTHVLVVFVRGVKRCVFQALEKQTGTGFTLGTWSTNARDCSRVCSLRCPLG